MKTPSPALARTDADQLVGSRRLARLGLTHPADTQQGGDTMNSEYFRHPRGSSLRNQPDGDSDATDGSPDSTTDPDNDGD